MNGDTTQQPMQPQSAVPQVNVLPQPQAPSTAGMTTMTGQDPRAERPKMTFKAHGVAALALATINALKERKQRELDKDMQHFVGISAGRDEAQAQLQQTDGQIRAAMQKIQANPHDQEARQSLVQASAARKKAQTAMQQNDQNLRDLANSPRGAKFLKQLEKAAGIDEKQMNSPERQSLIRAIQKQQNTDAQTAKIMSLLTPRQQLSPEARAQSQMQQAGVLGKPATGGQQLHAYEQEMDRRLKAEALAHKVDLDTEKMIEKNRKDLGLVPVSNEDGSAKRDPKGQIVYRNLEESEMSPEELQKYKNIRAQEDLRTAQAKAVIIKANAAKLNAESAAKHRAQMSSPGYLQQWANMLSDPSQKASTIGTPPKEARGAILSLMAQQGKKLAYPLGGKEISTMDLANSAVENIERARAVLQRRPDLFGPSGFFGSKFEMAFKGGDPDAADFYTAINLANLPAVGIHGVRGKWALQDLHTLDGNLYRNPESMTNVLDDIYKSASEFREMANRPPTIRGTSAGGGISAPPRPKNVPDNYVFRDGKQGRGWYKP